jgi:3'(2'), 5'-bisphosphate nucleotidase
MNKKALEDLLMTAIKASVNAGKAIMEVYNSADFNIQFKEDTSPLTRADVRSHEVINNSLKTTPYPVLSEEGRGIPYSTRKEWEYFWLVDPLDGTKEFIKRNGEFTVNIALVHIDTPVLGVIYVPFTRNLYFAIQGEGAYKMSVYENSLNYTFEQLIQKAQRLEVEYPDNTIKIVASRSHMSDETREFIEHLSKNYNTHELVSIGSSLKLCLVAEGAAHIYPRLGPTMEWDIAAGIIIAREAGAEVVLSDGVTPLKLNKEELLNPSFIVKPERFTTI